MVVKQKLRSMEQNRDPRNKPTWDQLISSVTKEANLYKEKTTLSSVSGAGKTEQLNVKE